MARVTYQTVETDLPLRAGAQWEVAALAPFPQRANPSLWALTRPPFSHARPFAAGGTLGRTIAETRAAQQPARVYSPQQRSYVLALDHASTAALRYTCMSSQAIPWPFRVVGFTLLRPGGISQVTMWNLAATDGPWRGIFATPPPGLLITPEHEVPLAGALTTEDLDLGPIVTSGSATNDPAFNAQLIGRSVHHPGKYLTLVARAKVAGGNTLMSAIATIEQIWTPADSAPLAAALAA